MFISRPTEPRTVLLWGDRWWFPRTGGSREFTNLENAAEVLADHFTDEPKPLPFRLVFQPEALETVATPCPQGDRRTLGAALAGEFPALGKPDHAWSHEPVMPAGTGFATLLHYETHSGLFALATLLAHYGLAVESAWPLATFLHALPVEWTDTGAVTVVAVEDRRAVAYQHPADGDRTIRRWTGDATVAEVGQWLSDIFAGNAEEPVLLVLANDEVGDRLDEHVSLDGRPNLEQSLLSEALARPVVLPRYHPAQLLPRLPVVTAQRAAIAASLAFLCFAGWTGAVYARDTIAARAETEQRQGRITALRSEVEHLRANASEIAGMRGALAGGSAGPPCGALMDKLSATLPAEIVLASLRISERSISTEGWVAPAAAPSVLDEWRARLAPADSPWTIAVKMGNGGAFTLTGSFRL